jgi:nucleotide-binding universal stress UspA family protein
VHVLVGTDGSQLAVNAARHGVGLLRPEQVTVLTVITKAPIAVDEDLEEGFPQPDEQDRLFQAQLDEADAAFARTAAALVGPRVEARVEGGDVASAICEVARELGVDAIVVGSHGRGGLGRLVRGSVSEHVARHAPCAVLVVPADAGTP